jgi:DNA-binding MarR family transcriptional regulator
LLPVLRAMDADSIERRARTATETSAALLRIIASNPKGTQRQWATELGKPIGAMTRELNKLKNKKLIEDLAGKWSLTAKGKRAVKRCANADENG